MVERAGPVFGPHLEVAGQRAAHMARRFQWTLGLAALVGVVVGLAVAAFDSGVAPVLELVLDQGLLVFTVVPAAGLLVVGALGTGRRWRDMATTDAYVRAYHQRDGRLRVAGAWHKLIASAVTLASGNAFGFEGPSILLGSTVGSHAEHRFRDRFQQDDAKVLMVAGAAAGVAAIFKAPLTGVVFALEVPYRSDLARRAMLPSLVAAGASYVTFVSLVGTAPLLSTGGSASFDLRDLLGGLVLGIVCGVLARIGTFAIGVAKQRQVGDPLRIGVAVVGLVALAPLAHWWLGGPFHLGPSYDAIEWAVAPDRTIPVLVAAFALRATSTWLGVFGGGVGGLFIPLVTQGAITGAICQQLVDAPNANLFPTIGIAAFLGAGYRTPLAGVAFVAEATGEPGFLVPALLAAAASQIVMGGASFCPYQRSERLPDVEPLTAMAVSEILVPNADTVDASMTLRATAAAMMRQNRRWAPVIADGSYVGLVAMRDIGKLPSAEWGDLTVRDVMRTDVVPARPDESVMTVAERLRSSDAEAIAVTEGDRVVGVVTLRDLRNVEVLLDRLTNEAI